MLIGAPCQNVSVIQYFWKTLGQTRFRISFAAGHLRDFNMLIMLKIIHFPISLTMDAFCCAILTNISLKSCREYNLF